MSYRDTVNAALLRLYLNFTAVPLSVSIMRQIPPPKGDPVALGGLADVFGSAASPTDQVSIELVQASDQKLPEIWTGRASVLAGDVVVAVAEDIANAATVLGKVRTILSVLSDGIFDAHQMHANAQDVLLDAARQCDSGSFASARSLAVQGGIGLLAAMDAAVAAGARAARDLNKLTSEAHAHALKSGNLDASDRVVLGEAANPEGQTELNRILTFAQAQRAGQRLDQMSDDDRKRFDALLSQAKSPEERAYLMKTLAAGHDIGELESFDSLIHGHGNDPDWLQQHLSPIINKTDPGEVDYQPAEQDPASWTQGTYPTCVASSTITARAMIDPAYNLKLTTGNKPDDPDSTSKEAFEKRLRDEQASLYDHGRDEGSLVDRFKQDFRGQEGMTPVEGRKIADEQIGAATGQTYEQLSVGDANARQAALPAIELAVDQGQPVPIQLSGTGIGHQVLIIGHDGDKLEIYNPWGTTSWVSEDSFINSRMNELPGSDGKASGVPPNVAGILLPH
ncbi:hypothetical protein ACFXHA_22225 [Nocardia sp. NPDC059240]|uniref:hypothetical protein n=1 Tax=Nocardia sp. NPDC059240 TaxID=3346786 RepID=UPI00367EB03F